MTDFNLPKDPEANKQWRINLIQEANNNKELQSLLIAKCTEDIIFFLNAFGWTYDPRISPSEVPFITYDYQDVHIREQIQCIEDEVDSCTEKSRDMGFSWMIIGIQVQGFLFKKWASLYGSYKEDYVDEQGNMDSHFERIRFMLNKLPAWMKPNDLVSKYMNISSEKLGCSISGDAGQNFGTGGRRKFAVLDEFALWQHDKKAFRKTADIAPCRIFGGTPEGRFNVYGKIMTSHKDYEDLSIKRLRLHWQSHPLKDGEWYLKEQQKRTKLDIAKELDISYDESVTGAVYKDFQRISQFGDYKFDPKQKLYTSWDFGRDMTAIIWFQKDFDTGMVTVIDAFQKTDMDIDFFAAFVTGQPTQNFVYTDDETAMIEKHRDWRHKYANHYGDPYNADSRSGVTQSTFKTVLRGYGINIQTNRNSALDERIRNTALSLKRLKVNDSLTEFIQSIIQSRYPQLSEASQATAEKIKPVHDENCLHPDTLIRTLFGWHKIKDLVGKEFYVWSYSHSEGRLVPTKAKKCWKSDKNRELIEVGLDSGRSIKCTPEHRFMLRDGSYKEAQLLKKGDSLMPFYERKNNDYLNVDLNDGSRCVEHRYVFHRFNGVQTRGYHIDHIDEQKDNNNPENLQILSQAEHCRKGQSWESRKAARSQKRVATITKKEFLRDCAFCKEEALMCLKQIYCSKKCSQLSNNLQKRLDKAKNYIDRTCVWCGDIFKGTERTKTCTPECAANRKKEYSIQYGKALRAGDRIKITDSDRFDVKNHKVRFVKQIEETSDVYDIEVPEYHNFAAEGVILHNSHMRTALEYFFDNEPKAESGSDLSVLKAYRAKLAARRRA